MGVIRTHPIGAGTTGVPRETANFTTGLDVTPGVDIAPRGSVQLFIRERDLPTAVRTINLISFTFTPDGQGREVFTPTTFGNPSGAGTGNGNLFAGAIDLQTTGVVNTDGRGYLVTYSSTAARDLADRHSMFSPFRTDTRYEVAPAVVAVIGTETTLDAEEGGTVVEFLTLEGHHASNAQSERLTFTVGTDPNTLTRPVRRGSYIPGNAVVESTNEEVFFLTIES